MQPSKIQGRSVWTSKEWYPVDDVCQWNIQVQDSVYNILSFIF